VLSAKMVEDRTMVSLLFLAVTIQANFEAGNIGKVEIVSDTHVRCAVTGETDQDGRNRQPSWFYLGVATLERRARGVESAG
jgi:hypothetical protein